MGAPCRPLSPSEAAVEGRELQPGRLSGCAQAERRSFWVGAGERDCKERRSLLLLCGICRPRVTHHNPLPEGRLRGQE